MPTSPDSPFILGPVFHQAHAPDILVTPAGGIQMTLARALAGDGLTIAALTAVVKDLPTEKPTEPGTLWNDQGALRIS